MKKSSLLICFCALAFFASAQPSTSKYVQGAVGNSGREIWSQWWNCSNVYHNPSQSTAKKGGQLDTFASGNTYNLQTSRWFFLADGGSYAPVVNADTLRPWTAQGYGNYTVQAFVLNAGSIVDTAVLYLSLEKSLDGVNFIPIPGQTVYTLSPTHTSNATVPLSCEWDLTNKDGDYYEVNIVCNAKSTLADTASAWVLGRFQPVLNYSNNGN